MTKGVTALIDAGDITVMRMKLIADDIAAPLRMRRVIFLEKRAPHIAIALFEYDEGYVIVYIAGFKYGSWKCDDLTFAKDLLAFAHAAKIEELEDLTDDQKEALRRTEVDPRPIAEIGEDEAEAEARELGWIDVEKTDLFDLVS